MFYIGDLINILSLDYNIRHYIKKNGNAHGFYIKYDMTRKLRILNNPIETLTKLDI